jgi:hypothetical protein
MHRWSPRARTRAGAGLAACALTALMTVTGATGASAATGVGGASGAPAAGPAWKIQHSGNATLPGGQLESVSCSSASACTAVGNDRNPVGISVTLAERWNGTAWQRQHTPNPAGDTSGSVDPSLLGVSCPALDYCEAVGSYRLGNVSIALAEVWNGRGWRMQRFPVPAGDEAAGLNQVSCTSAQFCEAVGSRGDVTLAATWNGTSWHLQRTPNPAGTAFDQLSTVACSSPAFCEAWGSGNSGPTFAEQWDGTSWRLQTVPPNVTVNSVSCVSVTFCEAVGSGGTALAWNGSSWTAQALPGPADSAGLRGVSCLSPAFCELVGTFNNNGPDLPLAATWNGSAWSVQPAPNPAHATFTGLNSVSCASAGSCEAGGSYQQVVTSGDPIALAEGWNGHAWLLQRAVTPPGATLNSLDSVSCVSASFCEAVGEHFNTSGNQTALAEQWNGTSWKIQAVPLPPPELGSDVREILNSVSCISATFCEAVGTGGSGPNAEMWNGTSWTVQARPGFDVTPQAVSCGAVDFCVSVNGAGQVNTWDGTAWSAATSVPGFRPFTSVSCVSASFCEAVGQGPAGENAVVWNGSTWTPQPTAGDPGEAPNAVSCSAVNSCEAVGSTGFLTFAEAWDGSTWTLQSTPNPSGFQFSLLSGVSCTSADSCTAVGQSQTNGQVFSSTLGEVWDGTAWTLRSTPNKPTAGRNILSGVSCGASRMCTAVGGTQDIGGISATLVETGD